MIVLLFLLCGVTGAVAAGLVSGLWMGAAMLLGLDPPTPDQVTGLCLIFGCTGTLGSAMLAGVMLLRG